MTDSIKSAPLITDLTCIFLTSYFVDSTHSTGDSRGPVIFPPGSGISQPAYLHVQEVSDLHSSIKTLLDPCHPLPPTRILPLLSESRRT